MLEHNTEPRRNDRYHKANVEVSIPNTPFVGPRGGKKIPTEIVWKPVGTGMFTSVFHTCGCAVLYPYVRYHNGNGKLRTMHADDWVKKTGMGKINIPDDTAFKQKLLECQIEREKYGQRTYEIVKSIVDNGGTVTFTN